MIFFASQAFAQWEQLPTPRGTTVNVFYESAGEVYAGTSHGVFRLEEGEWQPLGDALNEINVTTIISHNGYLFAGTSSNGIYRTSNEGTSWVQVNNNLTSLNVRQIKLYKTWLTVAASGGVFMSDNNGLQWENKTNNLASTSVTSVLQFNDSLFVGTSGGIYISADNGEIWKSKNTGLPTGKNISSMLSVGTRIISALSSGGVYISDNEADTWFEANTDLINLNVKVLYNASDTLYAGTTNGLFYTLDPVGSISWSSMDVAAPYSEILAINKHAGLLLTGNSFGAFQEDEDGFSILLGGFPALTISNIFSVESHLYVSSNKGIRKFNTGTNEWDYEPNFPGNSVGGIVRYNDTTYLAYNENGIYASYDTAKSWTQKKSQAGIQEMAVVEGSAIFIGTTGNGIYRSLNHGQTWVQANIGLNSLNVSRIVVVDDYIFAVSDRLYRTDSNGDEWEPVGDDISLRDLDAKQSVLYRVTGSNILYCALWRSEDYGQTWTTIVDNVLDRGYENNLLDLREVTVVGDMILSGYGSIDISLEDDDVWYRFGKGYQSSAALKQVILVNDALLFVNEDNELYNRQISTLVPVVPPSDVSFVKNNQNVITISWSDHSDNESSFGIRRYWEFADISVPANTEETTFDIDEISNAGYFYIPFYVYANDNGDWSQLTRSNNGLPTIDAINDTTVLFASEPQSFYLNGVSDGGENNQEITIAASSSDENIVKIISTEYFTGSDGAVLHFLTEGFGTATITITLSDDGDGNNTTTETFNITVDSPTGIESMDPDFLLYPNPVKSTVTMDFKSRGKRLVSVYNAAGILIGSSAASSETLNLNASSYRPGLYFIEVIDSKGRTVSKIIKE